MVHFDLPYHENRDTPLGALLRRCEVYCVAMCCGMGAFDVSTEQIQHWADTATPSDLEIVRRQLEEVLEQLEEAPDEFFFLDCEHTRQQVTEWFESIRVVLGTVQAKG
ncbi:MAG TPA: DUF6331 family protein [Phycisphaerales bacterium]|nr:DUF6331 family protein [Phycisphaerales bacterium]